MNWKIIVGRATPWALAAVASFLKEVLQLEIGWWPTLSAAVIGVIQFIISRAK
jgi:nitrate reductase NapE component